MQKLLFLCLCSALAFFQYQLWYGKGGITAGHILQSEISHQQQYNLQLQQRNDNVVGHLEELKGSSSLMEARARRELNLIKPNETLVILPGALAQESIAIK